MPTETSGPDYEAGYIEAMVADQDGDSDPTDYEAVAENQPREALAKPHSRHRLLAVGSAERRLIAAVVRHPGLFTATLADGSSLDEAISPAELAHPDHRRLYQRVYGALAEGQNLTLPGLCSDLSMDSEDLLRQLLLTADAELDRALPEPPPAAMTSETSASSDSPPDVSETRDDLLSPGFCCSTPPMPSSTTAINRANKGPRPMPSPPITSRIKRGCCSSSSISEEPNPTPAASPAVPPMT